MPERFRAFLTEMRRTTHALDAEGSRETGRPDLADEIERAAGDYERALAAFDAIGGDLLGALAPYAAWTSSATHAVLPLLATTAGLRLQLRTGIDGAPRALRRMARRLLAAGVRACALARPAAGGGRRARDVRRPDRRLRPRRRAPAAPARHRGRPAARPDRPRGHRARLARRRLPVARRLPRLPPPHHAPPQAVGQRRRGLRPRARAGAGARRRAGVRGARARAVGGGGLCVCALDTELLGHWWYEGIDWLRVRRGGGRRPARRTSTTRWTRPRRRPIRCR